MDKIVELVHDQSKYDLFFNNQSALANGFLLDDFISVGVAKRRYTTQAVAGRNGALIVDDGTVDNVPITCRLITLERNERERFQFLQDWFEMGGRLILPHNPQFYYRVLMLDSIKTIKDAPNKTIFEVVFICEPFEYELNGDVDLILTELELFSPYKYSFPVYIITGEGVCELNVNGNIMTANIGQNLVIDTYLLEAYKLDGTSQNTNVSGDYEKLRLVKGMNSIYVSEGFNLKIKTNWGYRL